MTKLACVRKSNHKFGAGQSYVFCTTITLPADSGTPIHGKKIITIYAPLDAFKLVFKLVVQQGAYAIWKPIKLLLTKSFLLS